MFICFYTNFWKMNIKKNVWSYLDFETIHILPLFMVPSDPKITESIFLQLISCPITKKRLKKKFKNETPLKWPKLSKKNHKKQNFLKIVFNIYFLPLGQKWRVWEMCTQPNFVPRPSKSLFTKSFFPDIKRTRKQHELLEYKA